MSVRTNLFQHLFNLRYVVRQTTHGLRHFTSYKVCADIWRSVAYLCCLCNPVAGAEHWAPDTLPPPLGHVHGHRGRCGCAGSGLSSCACCWWLRCPRGLRGEPAVHRWTDYPGPGRAEDSLVAKSIIVWYNCPAIKLHLMKDEMFDFRWNG